MSANGYTEVLLDADIVGAKAAVEKAIRDRVYTRMMRMNPATNNLPLRRLLAREVQLAIEAEVLRPFLHWPIMPASKPRLP